MAFKDEWRPRVDGVDEVNTSAVNEIAAEVIKQEEDIAKQQEQIEEIKEQISNNEGNKDFATETYVDEEIAKSETRANQIYANALKGMATGGTVIVRDVAPIEHDIQISAILPDGFEPEKLTFIYGYENGQDIWRGNGTGNNSIVVKSNGTYLKAGCTHPNGKVNVIVEYNKDINSVIGNIDTALDTIISQQESIIEIQNALIGGGNE